MIPASMWTATNTGQDLLDKPYDNTTNHNPVDTARSTHLIPVAGQRQHTIQMSIELSTLFLICFLIPLALVWVLGEHDRH